MTDDVTVIISVYFADQQKYLQCFDWNTMLTNTQGISALSVTNF